MKLEQIFIHQNILNMNMLWK